MKRGIIIRLKIYMSLINSSVGIVPESNIINAVYIDISPR